MSGFYQSYKSSFELRNILLICYSITAFVFIFGLKPTFPLNFEISILFAIGAVFLLGIFTICSIEFVIIPNIFNNIAYLVCIWIFGISIVIATLISDINVIVASTTLILVVVTAYSVQTTNEIARKQLKMQNDPIISMSIKENETDVRIIDLVIENVGNGIAKNVQFDFHPQGFRTLSGNTIEQLFFFQRGIQLLPSKQKYIVHLVNFSQKVQEIRARHHFPSDEHLSISEGQRFRRIVRDESELSFIVHFKNNEGEQYHTIFNFNLCIFWGLRFPVRQYR